MERYKWSLSDSSNNDRLLKLNLYEFCYALGKDNDFKYFTLCQPFSYIRKIHLSKYENLYTLIPRNNQYQPSLFYRIINHYLVKIPFCHDYLPPAF
jgi:hypothetical protein